MTPRPTLEPTRIGEVLLAGGLGLGVSWLLFWTLQGRGFSLPLVGPVAWLSVALIAAMIGWLGWRTRRELRTRPDALRPRTALVRVLLGKTSTLAAAALAGAYAGLLGLALDAWPAPLAVRRVVHTAVAIGMCGVWGLAGWYLERSCRIRPRDTPDTPPGDRQQG
ncbi:MAG: DUF3180 domain-containing protein [Propioniciclava sp.]